MSERHAADPRGPRPATRSDAGSAVWLSAHLRLAGGLYAGRGDSVLRDEAAPLVRAAQRRGWVRRCFFVRYSVGGPHLRLRLLGTPGDLEKHLWPPLRGLAGTGGVVAVEAVPYVPEMERYGGTAAAVEVAEDLFDASSRAVLALLDGLPEEERSARLGKGLLALLTGLSAFVAERSAAARLMRSYGTAYLRQTVPAAATQDWADRFAAGYRRQAENLEPFADTAWRALAAAPGSAAAQALPAALAAYRADLVRVRGRLRRIFDAGSLQLSRQPGEPPRRAEDWAEGIRGWLLSQLHMTSNRLGVTVAEETYLALAAAAALDPALRRSA